MYTNITGNSNIIANGQNELTLTCTTGVSYPVSDIRWYIGNTLINSTGSPTDQSADYGGVIRTRRLTIQPTRDQDGAVIVCEAWNEVNTDTPVRSSVTLDLTCKKGRCACFFFDICMNLFRFDPHYWIFFQRLLIVIILIAYMLLLNQVYLLCSPKGRHIGAALSVCLSVRASIWNLLAYILHENCW